MGVDSIWRSVALEKFSDQTVAQLSLENYPLEYCKKDILGHMKQFQHSRSEITTEGELILCRAGKTFFFSFQMCC
mgnify:CR=1 FL=1